MPKACTGLRKIDGRKRQLVAQAIKQFRAEDKGFVNRAAQRLPAQRGVGSIQAGDESRAHIIVASRVRNAQIQVSRFRDVLVPPKMSHNARVLPFARLKDVGGIAAEYLSVASTNQPFGAGRMRDNENPASSMPSSPPTRLFVASGRSINGNAWL